MKQYINIDYFKNDYGYIAPEVDNQQTADEKLNFYMKQASNRINVLVRNNIVIGLKKGYYIIENDLLKVNQTALPDQEAIDQELEKVEAIKEQIAVLTKFAIDTGYDFLTGSWSASIGSESFSDDIDFEASFARVEQQVKEALAMYDWGVTLIETDNLKVSFNHYDNSNMSIDSNDRYVTQLQEITFHVNSHLAGSGIIIDKNVNNGSITISLDPNVIGGNLRVDDANITNTEQYISATGDYFDGNIQ